jgi:16S rRNA (cytosine1402-N4)-methyltransferase
MVLTALRHVPVMLDRSVELLRPRAGGTYLDATLGLGGHAEAVLAASAPDGRVIGLDRDPDALAAARERLARFDDRLTVVAASFADLARVAADLGVEAVDGVLYDLGVSSLQLDQADRGFSYRADAPLDMRMDPTGGPTAADVVNTYPRAELARVLRDYGEERFAGRIARFIDDARGRAPVRTTSELVELVKAAVPAAARRTGPHPARRTFQALRIEVNGELAALEASLPQAIDLLAPGGRLVVLAYHSLEDRIVKRALAAAAAGDYVPPELPEHVVRRTPSLRLLTRRPEIPRADEVAANPRAESAKLRAAEKLAPPPGGAAAGGGAGTGDPRAGTSRPDFPEGAA